MNKNLLVSFSGGETSAFMAQWLNNNYKKLGYENIVFVFANTGLENEETLLFVLDCANHFKINIHWVEAFVYLHERKGTGYVITDFEHATRNTHFKYRDDTPFEMIIKKYGIPNPTALHCTRELKEAPIKSFAKVWFNGEKYDTAIGIRKDEADRMDPNYKEKGFIYPLINRNMVPSSKPMINFFWRKMMPFRLNLKGYQGNCATCWKKSENKLYKIAKENPEKFEFMQAMELKYGKFIPISRIEKYKKEGKELPSEITFFRNNKSAKQILEESSKWNGKVPNDADVYTWQIDLLGGDSCDVFSGCSSE
jgi:hypothetical protein